MDITVHILPVLSDNYSYLLQWEGRCCVIDPSESTPILKFLERSNLKLLAILNTHHHADHIGGNSQIAKETGCEIVGPDDSRIPNLDRIAQEGENLKIDGLIFEVFFVPGHTSTHIVYYLPDKKWLFSGDCLFNAGCGRLFEGTPQQMLDSLHKLMTLPDDTLIYPGHEYTEKNLSFAHSIEPHNQDVIKSLEDARAKRARREPTVPTTLESEKKCNPFLRAQDTTLKKALGMEHASELEVFTHVRQLRNRA